MQIYLVSVPFEELEPLYISSVEKRLFSVFPNFGKPPEQIEQEAAAAAAVAADTQGRKLGGLSQSHVLGQGVEAEIYEL